MTEHHFPVRVYIEDTDAGGIVFYANYLKYTERARTEWMRDFGYDGLGFMREKGMLFVVRDVQLVYKQPAVLDDMLLVCSRAVSVGKTSIRLAQNVVREKNMQLLVESSLTLVCIDVDARKPKPFPPEMRNLLIQTLHSNNTK